MKSVRAIAVADHLWAAFERMAEEMGSDPDALVNEAMHAFARQRGFVPAAGPAPAAPAPQASPQREGGGAPAGPVASGDLERRAVAERVLETAARLERSIHEEQAPGLPATLVLVRSDGVERPVTKERFVIGRGRHCDLVIDSGKVSREHAIVARDDLGWSIEDLGSSNGTWHRRERISRRRIQDGDEYFICSERLRCVLR